MNGKHTHCIAHIYLNTWMYLVILVHVFIYKHIYPQKTCILSSKYLFQNLGSRLFCSIKQVTTNELRKLLSQGFLAIESVAGIGAPSFCSKA